MGILGPRINICSWVQQNKLHPVIQPFFVQEFSGTPWYTGLQTMVLQHRMLFLQQSTSGHIEWMVALVCFWCHTPNPCKAIWILCSRAKSPMKNCNRRVKHFRMLTQKLNFMDTHAEKICIYVKFKLRYFIIWVYLLRSSRASRVHVPGSCASCFSNLKFCLFLLGIIQLPTM